MATDDVKRKLTAIFSADVVGQSRLIGAIVEDLVYSYVKAIIVAQMHSLQVCLGDQLVEIFDYQFNT